LNQDKEKIAIQYLKDTKETFFLPPTLPCFFNIIHLDIDSIREYFTSIGYNGSNSELFQKPSSWGVHFLFDEAVKKKGLSIIMDSNFSSYELANRNIKSLIKRGYNVEIYYIYDDLKKCFLYTKKREAITKRKVPEDVFFNSVVKSRQTVINIKKEYQDDITLNLIDKTTNSEYSDISIELFEKTIPIFKGEF